MIYHVIGLMSGSSLDGLDMTFVELCETAGKWTFEIKAASCLPYEDEWVERLRRAVALPASAYHLLHVEYGRWLGKSVNAFIEKYGLHHKVSLVTSHGHTTFHEPEKYLTHQLGDGASLAAVTGLPVVSDLRAMDVAFGGQGAPIVPMGERLLFPEHDFFLNIGGIANVSIKYKPENTPNKTEIIAFDVCAANRVLNMLASKENLRYDEDGKLAASGHVNEKLLQELNELEYFSLPHPKSLANSFGTDIVFPMIERFGLSTEDALATCVEHIALQTSKALQPYGSKSGVQRVMITGGGAFNRHLLSRIDAHLRVINFEAIVPADEVVMYKEALIMALLGTLRWREQDTVLASVTGADRNSIGGALWLGTCA